MIRTILAIICGTMLIAGCSTPVNEPTKSDQLILTVDPVLLEPVQPLKPLEH